MVPLYRIFPALYRTFPLFSFAPFSDILDRMETRFNKKVQKHRRRLLPDNWQEKLPLRPVLFLLGLLVVVFLAILVNQPADSYLNNAEIDVLRKKGTLRVGVDENVYGLNQNGVGLEPALCMALSQVIFNSQDGCEMAPVSRHTVAWQMGEGNIDVAVMSLDKLTGKKYLVTEAPFYRDPCVLMGYSLPEKGALGEKRIGVLHDTDANKVLSQYQQRQGTDPGYVDKQMGRFNIYKAIALNGMGKEDEAKQVYDDYKETEFSKTPEGRITANDYLTAANRWVEAADNYRSLDALLGDKQKSYTLDDIESLVLKKYHANQMAGRRDSAVAVSLQISDALGKALAREKQIQEEEQVTIVREVEQMIANQAKETRQRQMGLWAALGILVLCIGLGNLVIARNAQKQRENLTDADFDRRPTETDN